MISVNKIAKEIIGIGTDAFSHVHIKAPQPNPEGEEKFATEISKQASEAMSSYGKATIKPVKLLSTHKDYEEEMKILLKKAQKTGERGTIPLDDAVKEFDMLDLSENQKADLILACAFQTKSNETIISRPALYMAKYAILDCYGKVPDKLDKAIKTAIYDDGRVFDSEYFYDLFKRDTWLLKRNVNLKKSETGSSETAHFNMGRKGAVYDALRKHSTQRIQVKITTTDIFTPLDQVGENLAQKLDTLTETTEIPQDLVKSMKKALKEYNFDLKKVFADYYSLLKECKTLEDVKTFYPELKFPTEIRKKDFNINTKIDLSARMQKGGIDKPVIEALQKLYTEFTPATKTFINIEGSSSTNVLNLKRAGYELSAPDDRIMEFLRECEQVQLKYRKISKMSKEKLEPLIEKHALRTSGVWKDFLEMTKTGKWMPIRLIKNKRAYPETTKYSTEKLVDTYLFNLFVKNPYQRYGKNPLSRFDKVGYLDEHAQGIINRTYMIRFLTKEKDMPANMSESEWAKVQKEFEEFKEGFDTEAIAKSIEHMEDNYHRHFYRNYWTNARFETLQKQMQKSQDIAYEKVIWGEDLRNKEVQLEQVKALVKAEDTLADEGGAKLLDPKVLSDYRYRVCVIKDPQLKEKFMSAIAQGQESNEEYFNVYNGILKEAFDGKHVDETKAKALINIHENYLSEVFEGSQNLTEAEYKQQFLSKYQTPNGIDYAKVMSDTQAETNYWKLSSVLIENNASSFLTELERRYQSDFTGMNEIMEKYLETPEVFREKFSTIFTNSNPNCPNIVLQRELGAFLEQIGKWHFDKDEIINLDKEKLGLFNDDFSQNIVIPKELKKHLWNLSGKNYDAFDEITQKLYQSGKKRTGGEKGTGIKTWTGKDYDAEIKILGKWGGWRLYAREATPQDIEKYGRVKYVFYDATKSH